MRKYLLIALATLPGAVLFSQNPFQKAYHLATDSAFVTVSTGSGSLIAGTTSGPARLWVQRLDAAGDILWSKSYQGVEAIRPTDLLPTGGNTYLMAFNSTDPALAPHSGWLLLNGDGAMVWSFRVFGLSRLWRAIEVPGGYVLVGAYRSAANEDWQALAIKITPGGGIVWTTVFGTPGDDRLADVWADEQGLLFVAGAADVGGHRNGLLAQLGSAGAVNWAQHYGTSSNDAFTRLTPLADDRLLLAGQSPGFVGATHEELWLVAARRSGNDATPVWSYTFAYTDYDFAATDLEPVSADNFVLAGNHPARALGNPGVLLNIDGSGSLNWAYRYGATYDLATVEDVDVDAGGLLFAGSIVEGSTADQYSGRLNLQGQLPRCGPQSATAALTRRAQQPASGALPTATENANVTAGPFSLTATNENPPPPTELFTPVEVGFSLSDSTICPGECVTITLTGSTPGATYSIDPDGGEPNPLEPGVVCFAEAGIFNLTRRGQLGQCRDSLTVALTTEVRLAEEQVNAFTPNGDEFNATFRPYFACPPVGFRMKIYNRWGQLVYTTDVYAGWDGTVDDEPAPTDTYYWVAEYSTSDEPGAFSKAAGEVTLIR
jgi:gliding motility-associated-like protein